MIRANTYLESSGLTSYLLNSIIHDSYFDIKNSVIDLKAPPKVLRLLSFLEYIVVGIVAVYFWKYYANYTYTKSNVFYEVQPTMDCKILNPRSDRMVYDAASYEIAQFSKVTFSKEECLASLGSSSTPYDYPSLDVCANPLLTVFSSTGFQSSDASVSCTGLALYDGYEICQASFGELNTNADWSISVEGIEETFNSADGNPIFDIDNEEAPPKWYFDQSGIGPLDLSHPGGPRSASQLSSLEYVAYAMSDGKTTAILCYADENPTMPCFKIDLSPLPTASPFSFTTRTGEHVYSINDDTAPAGMAMDMNATTLFVYDSNALEVSRISLLDASTSMSSVNLQCFDPTASPTPAPTTATAPGQGQRPGPGPGPGGRRRVLQKQARKGQRSQSYSHSQSQSRRHLKQKGDPNQRYATDRQSQWDRGDRGGYRDDRGGYREDRGGYREDRGRQAQQQQHRQQQHRQQQHRQQQQQQQHEQEQEEEEEEEERRRLQEDDDYSDFLSFVDPPNRWIDVSSSDGTIYAICPEPTTNRGPGTGPVEADEDSSSIRIATSDVASGIGYSVEYSLTDVQWRNISKGDARSFELSNVYQLSAIGSELLLLVNSDFDIFLLSVHLDSLLIEERLNAPEYTYMAKSGQYPDKVVEFVNPYSFEATRTTYTLYEERTAVSMVVNVTVDNSGEDGEDGDSNSTAVNSTTTVTEVIIHINSSLGYLDGREMRPNSVANTVGAAVSYRTCNGRLETGNLTDVRYVLYLPLYSPIHTYIPLCRAIHTYIALYSPI